MLQPDSETMSGPEDEIANLRRRCLGCGKCRRVCPSFEEDGCDPMEIMVGGDSDITLCIGCGKCSKVCRRTDPFRVITLLKENGLH